MWIMVVAGMCWILYGLAGMLFGKQFQLPKKFLGHSWTRDFITYRGASWILLGLPWILAYDAFHLTNISPWHMFWVAAAASAPSIVFTFIGDRWYEKKYLKTNTGKEGESNG